MSQHTFNFSSTFEAVQGRSPFTVKFDPTIFDTPSTFLSKISYGFPDKIVTRHYTFVNSTAVSAGVNKDIDSRVPVYYTFDGTNINEDNSTSFVVNVTATVGPNFNVTVYTLSANVILQYLTQNPTGVSQPYEFGEIHLLKTRVWGPGNSQVFILETKDPNFVLVNFNEGNQVQEITTV